ncbi:EF-Tu C-terminal domain-related protein [Streptomyces sp. NPDC002746]
MNQVDISAPEPLADLPLLMAIEEIYGVSGRGSSVVGTIERGKVRTGDEVVAIGLDKPSVKTTVMSIQRGTKIVSEAGPGDTVGLLLRGVRREDVERGEVITTPGSIDSYRLFTAEIALLATEEGGRSAALSVKARLQFHVRTTEVTGELEAVEGEEIAPGATAKAVVKLFKGVAMENGSEFSISESGRTVAKVTVAKVLS